jgi:hypothetical protein
MELLGCLNQVITITLRNRYMGCYRSRWWWLQWIATAAEWIAPVVASMGRGDNWVLDVEPAGWGRETLWVGLNCSRVDVG